MKTPGPYFQERLFVGVVTVFGVAGFWNTYFGAGASPGPHQHLHAMTNLLWLVLLLVQLSLLGRGRYGLHRTVGLLVLVVGPLLFASAALLSVHSAHKGLVSGEGDALIVQNVMTTLEVAFLILMAFVVRKRRLLHGAFLVSSSVLFLGIALFFTLTAFVPGFRIEGPDTFHRFAMAARTGQYVCLAVGVLFFLKDRRNNWPWLLAGAFFSINELIRFGLTQRDLIDPLTEFVGSMSQSATFIGSFAVLLALLASTGIVPLGATRPKPVRSSP